MVQVTDDVGVDLCGSNGDGKAHGLMSRKLYTDATELGNRLDLVIRVWGREREFRVRDDSYVSDLHPINRWWGHFFSLRLLEKDYIFRRHS